MYRISIKNYMNETTYRKLIEFACEKSDAFMCVTIKRNYDKEYKEKFMSNIEPFLQKIEPFKIKSRNDYPYWPYTIQPELEGKEVYVCLYRICNEAKELLMEPKSLFNWRYPYYPEDLGFFKDNYCWFYTTAHEEVAIIYVNEDELDIVRHMNIEFKYFKVDDNVLQHKVYENLRIPNEYIDKYDELVGYEISNKCILYEEYKIN